MDETGEPVVDSESEGECLTRREPPPPLPAIPPPACDADAKLAMEDARRGLPAEVTALDRLWNWPVACPEPDGETSELFEDVEDCLLVT